MLSKDEIANGRTFMLKLWEAQRGQRCVVIQTRSVQPIDAGCGTWQQMTGITNVCMPSAQRAVAPIDEECA